MGGGRVKVEGGRQSKITKWKHKKELPSPLKFPFKIQRIRKRPQMRFKVIHFKKHQLEGKYWSRWQLDFIEKEIVMGKRKEIFYQAFEFIRLGDTPFSFYSYSHAEACQTSQFPFSFFAISLLSRILVLLLPCFRTMTLEKAGFGLSLSFGTY